MKLRNAERLKQYYTTNWTVFFGVARFLDSVIFKHGSFFFLINLFIFFARRYNLMIIPIF